MHSNRVSIINDDSKQEGQQWGREHAPFINSYFSKDTGDTLSFFVRSYKNNKSTSSNLNRFETRKLFVPCF